MNAAYQEEQENAVAKRRIRNYLIDKRFQLGWVVRVVIVTGLIVSVMGYSLYKTLADASEQITAQMLGDPTLTPEAQEHLIAKNEVDKKVRLWTLIGGLSALVLVLAIVTIILTHKIAGPVYKMRRLFSTIDGNHLQLYGKLRKGDELQEVFHSFDEMMRRLREARHQDLDELQIIRDMFVSRSDSEDLTARIDEIIVRFRDSVKMD